MGLCPRSIIGTRSAPDTSRYRPHRIFGSRTVRHRSQRLSTERRHRALACSLWRIIRRSASFIALAPVCICANLPPSHASLPASLARRCWLNRLLFIGLQHVVVMANRIGGEEPRIYYVTSWIRVPWIRSTIVMTHSVIPALVLSIWVELPSAFVGRINRC